MSELNRIKLLELAIQAGATIENATKVADDWEQWATEDDPLRLDVPNIPDESYEGQLARVFTEEQVGIDWSRPQLVHLIDDPDFIVRTTGLVGFDKFQGYSNADGDIPDWYKKKRFKYHGEIPQEQPKKPQFANAKDGDGTCGLSCCICAKEEPKTTGLNFLEAIVACKDGLRINRKVWHPDYWLRFDHDDDYVRNMDGDTVSLNTGDALATDWQIVKS